MGTDPVINILLVALVAVSLVAGAFVWASSQSACVMQAHARRMICL